jgi:hypothetical protein
MNAPPRQLSLDEWDARYAQLVATGLHEPDYGGPLRRHLAAERDLRLERLRFDNSPAALRLWNLLLTENRRLEQARAQGEKLVGAMKDLGTVPVLAYALPGVRAFYPDGAWWTPCLMECSDGLLRGADALGVDASFCPVRALLPAFVHGGHFPRPDLLVCSAGAVCDDFSAVAQRLERLGFKVHWWEMPRRRAPEFGEPACPLPGGGFAPRIQVAEVREELERLAGLLGSLAGRPLDLATLAAGIQRANAVRQRLEQLRHTVFRAAFAPLPALELLVAEMLALHFCSDYDETVAVLDGLNHEVSDRVQLGQGYSARQAVRVYWVNPVADLRAMNLLEECGGRLCGTEFMFTHALDRIPDDPDPLEALARTALADPMVGSARERALRVVAECREIGAEALVVSRIPGASHCAYEGEAIRAAVADTLGLPTIEFEVPPVGDALESALRTRLEALMETARSLRPPHLDPAANRTI